MQTYLFYDIETTGLNKAFDQLLQFAAIRTDLNLNEIERYELKVKLNPDVIPSPGAMITHQISMRVLQEGISEWEAIQKIHHWFNVPGTISVGYNNLGFDDEFLRFSFYRHLLPPYTHQYANQCGRMDIYPMSVLYYLFKNSVITWPQKENKLSLKLEEINNCNQWVMGQAHHAMTDVEATLALARCFFSERAQWDYIIDFYQKSQDQLRSNHKEGLLISGKLGTDKMFQAPVLFLGNSLPYKHQLWLQLDSESLASSCQDNHPNLKLVIKKKLGEPGFILPFKNRFLTHLSAERLERTENNKKWLQAYPDYLNKLIDYHVHFTYPTFPDVDANARLYLDDFWTFEEKQFCTRFHEAAPNEKAFLTAKLKNSTLKKLATRLLGRYYPNYLTETQAEEFAAYLKSIHPKDETQALIDHRGERRLTPTAAFQHILLLLKQNLSSEKISLLDELKNYLMTWEGVC